MGKKSPPLTKLIIDKALPGSKQYDLWDGAIPGFGIRISASGSKTYIVRYRADGGGRGSPQRFHVIGRHGVLTLDQARKQAVQVLAQVTCGEDPASDRKGRRSEMTMSDLVDLYEEEGCFIQRGKRIGEPMKPLTKKYTISRLRNHVVPLLGPRRITDIVEGDIERFSRDVCDGRAASDKRIAARTRVIVRGGDGAARKLVRDLSAVFNFAMRRKLVGSNPVKLAAVRKVDNQRSRYLTLDELKRLGSAFQTMEAQGANLKAITIARLWALTGCRREEIAALQWSEVDFDEGLLVLADTKMGKSVRPLNSAAATLLMAVERTDKSPYVFPAESGEKHYQGTKRIWNAACKGAGLVDVTPHTLRHTLGSTATSNGEALALTGALLGHANPRSTAIYAHIQTRPMKRAAERVGSKIANALGIDMPKQKQIKK